MSQNPGTKRLLIGGAAILGLVVALPLAKFGLFFYWMLSQKPHGPLALSQEWPAPILELYDEMKTQIQVPTFEVYLLNGQPRWTVSTAMCRIEDAPGVFDFLQAKLELKTVPADQDWDNLFFVRALPEDWRPASRADARYFASQHWLDGGEGPLYALARDPQTNRLFLYYYFNF